MEELEITELVLGISLVISILGFLMVYHRLRKSRDEVKKLNKEYKEITNRLDRLDLTSFINMINKYKFQPISGISLKVHLVNSLYQIKLINNTVTITSFDKKNPTLNELHCLNMYDMIFGTNHLDKHNDFVKSNIKHNKLDVSTFTNHGPSSKLIYYMKTDEDITHKGRTIDLDSNPVLYVTEYTCKDCTSRLLSSKTEKDLMETNLLPSLRNLLRERDIIKSNINNDNVNLKRIENTNLFLLSYRRTKQQEFQQIILKIE